MRTLAGFMLLALAASAQAAGPAAPASSGQSQANPRTATSVRVQLPSFVNSEVLAALQAVSAQNQCMSYAYDHNGNILTKTDQAFSASPTWGSSAFGCFTWTAP